MFRQTRLDWFTSRNVVRTACRRNALASRSPQRRALRFEPLEDRRLLAITVDTLIDQNDGIGVGGVSLREAIAAAMPGDTINFSVTGTILLKNGQLEIDKPLVIDGPGAALLTINASGSDPTPELDGLGIRAFHIDDGFLGTPIDVEISGLSITGGDTDENGGAIDNHENLLLADSSIFGNHSTASGGAISHTGGMLTLQTLAIVDNHAHDGGALYNDGGTAHIFNSVLRRNEAVEGGGAILNWQGAQLLVSESTLHGNAATDGGAILNNNSDFTIVGSTLSGNVASHSGGALRNTAGTGTVFGSTLSGNTARYGGGLYIDTDISEITTISNSTISGNTATDGGGGIYNFLGHAIIQFSTIAGNKADFNRGGGIASWNDPGVTLTNLYSTIVADSLGEDDGPGTDIDLVGGPVEPPSSDSVVSLGFNLVVGGTALDLFTAEGDLTEISPLLGPLADNGGRRLTHALLLGSPALDAGNPADEADVGLVPESDQRGAPFTRVFDGDHDNTPRIDIGALESDYTYFVVDTIDDENDGDTSPGDMSLREAIIEASFVTEGTPVILFGEVLTSEGPNVLFLTLGQLAVNGSLIIEGPGADRLTIQSNNLARIFDVNDGDLLNRLSVTIAGLTLTGGYDPTAGGAIFSQERLLLRDSVLTGNTSQWGGGLYNGHRGILTVLRSRITDNFAVQTSEEGFGSGGGLYNWGGAAKVVESTISGNHSITEAGGLRNANNGTLSIIDSTVSGNVTAFTGGGIRTDSGLLEITGSTISGNRAGDRGGGIMFDFGDLRISHSTITENVADADDDGFGAGGGIAQFVGGVPTLDHTIVAGNVRGSGARDDIITNNATPVAVRFSIIGDGSSTNFEDLGGNLIGTGAAPIDPRLGPLAANGGPTRTHRLLVGSPAIDVGDPEAVAGLHAVPEFDQRGPGFDRIRDGNVAGGMAMDIGALEVQQFVPPPELPGDYNLDRIVDAADYTIWRDTLGSEVDQYDGADGDGDGIIGPGDYQKWKENFGESLPEEGGGRGAVSETLALAGSASLDGTILVTTLADSVDLADGLTSLREAIFAANIVSGLNTIEFDPALTAGGAATILLTLGELAITDTVIINGPGADLLTIDASGNDVDPSERGNGTRIFNVDDGVVNTLPVEIRDLTLTGGDSNEPGGAIRSREMLLAERLNVVGNWAESGGAIALYVTNGQSTIADCNLTANIASSFGGAIFLQFSSAGTAIIRDSTFAQNEANRGGALYVVSSTADAILIVDGNKFADNSANLQGGAIHLPSTTAPKTTIRSSLLSGNSSLQQGGAIFANGVRDLAIIDSRLVENRTLSQTASQGRGGAIYATAGDISITGSTISGNSALSGGGINSRNGELTINFSTIADNQATAGDGGGIYSNLDRLSIVGSTISGNVVTGTSSQLGRGGGLWHSVGPAPATLQDTLVTGNSATNAGGGAFFRSVAYTTGSSVLLSNASFTANSAVRGGGLAFGDNSFSGSAMFAGGSITNNTATTNGGGVYGSAYSMLFQGTTITGNHANGSGGGVATSQSSGRSFTNLSFVGATIDGNSAGTAASPAAQGFGGGIYVPASGIFLSLLQSSVSQNSARVGGGIARTPQTSLAPSVIVDSTITGNTSTSHGAGIYQVGSSLSLTRSTVSNNVASPPALELQVNGGGIFARSADVTLLESSLTGNSTTTGRGGGVFLDSGTGDLTVTATTIAGNSARQDGGGVWDVAINDRVLIQSSTISGNSSAQGTGGLYLRGNIAIRHSTISKNIGGGTRPGGLLAGDGARQLELDHTIVAGNSHLSGAPPDLRLFLPTSAVTIRSSLIGDNTSTTLVEAPLGSPDVNGNLIGKPLAVGGHGVIDPVLGPLADDGGRTLTHALLPGSPAIDGGALVNLPPLGYDQRGNPFSRMVDGTGDGIIRIDIGAYESQGVPSFSPGDFNRDGLVDACDYTIWRSMLGEFVSPFDGADGDGDGTVDVDDYDVWRSHFGQKLVFSTGGGSAALSLVAESATEVASVVAPSLAGPLRSDPATNRAARFSAPLAATPGDGDALVAWLSGRSHGPAASDEAFAVDEEASEVDTNESDSFSAALEMAFATFGAYLDEGRTAKPPACPASAPAIPA